MLVLSGCHRHGSCNQAGYSQKTVSTQLQLVMVLDSDVTCWRNTVKTSTDSTAFGYLVLLLWMLHTIINN